MTANPELPLSGITVLSLEQAVAAPFATRQLADLGARVIKVERPAVGDFARGYDRTVRGLSSHFVWLNRGKESIELDLKHPDGRAVLDALVAKADVVVQNLAPGAAARLGLGADELRAQRPELITVSISGYGDSGPYRDRKAYDLLVQAESGLLSITGTPEQPSKAGISIADISAGMYAYTGTLTALFRRATAGVGSTVDVSMLDALGEWMGYPAYYAGYGGTEPPRTGATHATIAPYGPFPTASGEVLIGLQNEREWKSFCDTVLQQPTIADDPRFTSNSARVTHRGGLNALIASVTGTLPLDKVTERLDAAGIAWAKMRTVQEFLDHPQHNARNRWRRFDSPVGPLRALLPPATIRGQQVPMGAVPDLGEHTDTVLRWLGFADEVVASLRAAGAIGAGSRL